MPAHQRLHAKHLARWRQLRLVVQRQFASPKRLAQAVFDAHVLGQPGRHVTGEKLEVVATAFLGAVHRDIGVFQQFIRRHRIGGEEGDPHAGAAGDVITAHLVGHGQRIDQLRGNPDHLFRPLRIHQHDGEFIAAQARHRIGFTHAILQPARHFDQQIVADGMAQGVVDRFEVIQIDEHQRHHRLFAPGLDHRLAQAVLKQHAVRQPGERVEIRQVGESLAGIDQFGNIGGDADEQFLALPAVFVYLTLFVHLAADHVDVQPLT